MRLTTGLHVIAAYSQCVVQSRLIRSPNTLSAATLLIGHVDVVEAKYVVDASDSEHSSCIMST